MIPSVYTGFQTRLGYREFFAALDGTLRSASFGYVWVDGENEGNCYADHCDTPEDRWNVPSDVDRKPGHEGWVECACGFYAYNKPSLSTTYVPSPYRVVGIVELYGKVIVAEFGYRAERARIIALGLTPDDYRATVANKYSVPHLPHESMVQEYLL